MKQTLTVKLRPDVWKRVKDIMKEEFYSNDLGEFVEELLRQRALQRGLFRLRKPKAKSGLLG